jgi:DNA-binding LytR/AlgR family response regulator
MLNVVIIEDEQPAQERLSNMLGAMNDTISVTAKLHSVKESVDWFSRKTQADLVFSDVQLQDGLSFDIFEQSGVWLPVVFVTEYDRYMLRAFETNGIDYLLKPLAKNDIEKAIASYYSLRSHFTNNRLNMPLFNLDNFITHRKRSRLLVKQGMENVPLMFENIAMLYVHDKGVRVVDRDCSDYCSDKTLTELEDELNHDIFFRANRQFIINIGFVRSFKPHERVKIMVELAIGEQRHSIIVSQETAVAFRKWMADA